MPIAFGPRRGQWIGAATVAARATTLSPDTTVAFVELDRVYRALCAILYNYGPTTGHPGGAISAGRIAQALLFETLDLDASQPHRQDADVLTFAAGHKALGLYALLALADEALRVRGTELLPPALTDRLRLEDLLGFRRNPMTQTPLFHKLGARALDGHPTPATPTVRFATGASGVGLASSIGYALAAVDIFGGDAPKVHVVEGEGGLTPGRVNEALAAAGTASLHNLFVHVDWNQASIDSERVCRDGETPGDYVQWSPSELFYLHDWNVIEVTAGRDFSQIVAAQRLALELDSGQPTAVIYRTVKGWEYGIEGRASHGAGHKLCSPGFYASLANLLGGAAGRLSHCGTGTDRCHSGADRVALEECYWHSLELIRERFERDRTLASELAARLHGSRDRLERRGRMPRADAPRLSGIYEIARALVRDPPDELAASRGAVTPLRDELGRVLGFLNQASGGALMIAAADLLDSTSIGKAALGFPTGFWHAHSNRAARRLAAGGIAEDAMAGLLSGLSSFGCHIGVGSSYGAFMAPLGHIAARLHAIGGQARWQTRREPHRPMILVCAHASVLTGEDGPTHADPQALQLLQENFPAGALVTLTPSDAAEIWSLVCASLTLRPAVIAPFVTRPPLTVPDRAALGLAPATAAVTGVYCLKAAAARHAPTVVLQGSGVAQAFVQETLPGLTKLGLDLAVYVVASAELFAALPTAEQERIFPSAQRQRAMAVTEFTLPTTWRLITAPWGRACTLHPFAAGHFLGSGSGQEVLAEAGLDGDSQLVGIRRFVAGLDR
jgi:transketolase